MRQETLALHDNARDICHLDASQEIGNVRGFRRTIHAIL